MIEVTIVLAILAFIYWRLYKTDMVVPGAVEVPAENEWHDNLPKQVVHYIQPFRGNNI